MEDNSQDPLETEAAYAERSTLARLWYEARLCTGFLTRIPVFALEYSGHASLAAASWAFPVVGIVVGLVGAIVLWLADGLGLPGQISALIAIATIIAVSGGLHEDGLADAADAFGLSGDRDVRLAAMHDVQTGVYGVLALVVVFAARWSALALLAAASLADAAAALIAATAASRGVLPYIMHAVPQARTDGLSVSAGQPEVKPAFIALIITAVVALLLLGFGHGLVALIVGGLAAFAVVFIAKRLIGGQTGDVLGAVQQVSEAAILIAAVGLMS